MEKKNHYSSVLTIYSLQGLQRGWELSTGSSRHCCFSAKARPSLAAWPGQQKMRRRAGKALAAPFLGCCPCSYPCARKSEQQHSAPELPRAVSGQQRYWRLVGDFQDKRAECNQEEVAEVFPRAVVSGSRRRWI